ncbi:MAG TPA: Holliday junction resolvase RuvX [Armatimonadota bacterium]
METYLGLDVGDRRIGVAVSRLGTMAMPLEVITRDGSELDRIAALAMEHEAAAIVAGMPYSLDGTLKPQAQKVQAFIVELGERVHVPIETVDERLTTSQANRMLIAADRKSKQRKQVVDQVAATLILQTYLDMRGGGA